MCGSLETYISGVAKEEEKRAKDDSKVLKTLQSPVKEGHHFDQALGGVHGLFENLRANTQAESQLHLDTSKNLSTQVLPVLERLHAEIKEEAKKLSSSAGKSSKAVESARQASQKHIELLGSHTATMDSQAGRVEARNDPYVLQRGVNHRLNRQILEENNNKADVLNIQNSFQQFEAHVITTVQAALNTYQQFMSGQADRQKAMYGDIAACAQGIPLDFEWNGFTKRNGHILVSPNAPPRSIDSVSFPNQNHRSTQPLIEGTLERKSRGVGALTGYSSGHYIVTPAGYLHEYKDTDDFKKDPTPEVSLHLADCTIGALDGTKFAIKGKDASGGKVSQKMSMSSDFNFKALTPGDAEKWHSIMSSMAGASGGIVSPVSPIESRADTGMRDTYERPTTNTEINQSQGVVGRSPAADVKMGGADRGAGLPSQGPPITANPPTAVEPEGSAPAKSGGFLGKLKRSS